MSITPFDERGALDEPAYRAHLRRMAINGEELADVLDATLKLNIAELPRMPVRPPKAGRAT